MPNQPAMHSLQQLETNLFGALNQFVEPLIRAGWGNPLLWPSGTIVVETTGRKTGRKINIPVLATRIGDLMVFGTVRRNSQWIKNLAATPDVRYWLAGRPREAAAIVFTPEHTELMPLATLPRRATWLAPLLQLQSQTFGVSFALLTPRS